MIFCMCIDILFCWNNEKIDRNSIFFSIMGSGLLSSAALSQESIPPLEDKGKVKD